MQVRRPIHKSAIGLWCAYEEFLGPLTKTLAEEAPSRYHHRPRELRRRTAKCMVLLGAAKLAIPPIPGCYPTRLVFCSLLGQGRQRTVGPCFVVLMAGLLIGLTITRIGYE